MRTRFARSCTLILIACGLAPQSLAQNALGDGRNLENNLSTQGRYNFTRRSLADEVRFRNAIVTGNAPGGLSFRGDIGYRAPGEFEAALGSDDLFSFRRDSLYSGLAGMGIRGSDALQYQFALTTGARPPANLVGNLVVPRVQPQMPTPSLSGVQDQTPTIAPAPVETIEPENPMMGSLRALSAYEANRAYQPAILGVQQQTAEGEPTYGMTASELRGVRRTELTEPPPSRIDTAQPGQRIETSISAMLEQLRKAAEELPPPEQEEQDTRSPWEIRLDELRQQMLDLQKQSGPQPTQQQPGAPTGQAPLGPLGPVQPEDQQNQTPQPGMPGPMIFNIDPDTLKLLRSAGPPARSFVPPDEQGVFSEHMRIGQEHLQAGRYFDAEERFAHALTVRPGDETAQIARIHAQIGAGMYLSAAVNLRTLMLEDPAIVAARFDRSLLPDAKRLPEVIEELQASADKALADDPTPSGLARGRAAGLLLAYLGVQTGDQKLVEQGVAAARSAIDKSGGQDRPENITERRLLDLIEKVWAENHSDE